MPRPASKQPTDGEMEILKVLWDDGPSDLGHICASLRTTRSIATTTVATMLKVMWDKGFVTRRGEVRAYVWEPVVSRSSTRQGLVGRFVDFVFDGSAKGLVTHLLEDGKLDERERREILEMLARADDDESAEEVTS